MSTPDFSAIDKAAERHARDRAELALAVEQLQRCFDTAKRELMPGIRRAVLKARTSGDALRAAVTEAPALFEKPRTRIFHGIKAGYRKGTGKLSFANEKKALQRLFELFEDPVSDGLIQEIHKPVKDALMKMPPDVLKKIGATITDTEDQVVVAPVDSDIDKLVSALLDGDVEEAA